MKMKKYKTYKDNSESLFNMGSPKPNIELSYSLLYEELSNEFPTYSAPDIRGKFEGPSGIRTKLETVLGFRTREFTDQKFEELKLLKLIYSYQQKNPKAINIINIMSKPSLENIDPDQLDNPSLNGKYFSDLKKELSKEIHPLLRRKAKSALINLCSSVTTIINDIRKHMISYPEDIQFLRQKKLISEQLLVEFSRRKACDYQHSLMETFYLKLLFHENIARQSDLLSMPILLTDDGIRHPDYILEMKLAANYPIPLNEIKDYIMNNQDLIGFILMKENVTQAEKKSILSYIQYIDCFKHWYEKHSATTYENNEIPLWIIISWLQLVFDIQMNKYTYKYTPYGYSSGSNTLSSKLKQKEDCPVFFQILLMELAKTKMLMNLGYGKQLTIIHSIEKTMDEVLLTALHTHNIAELEQATQQINQLK